MRSQSNVYFENYLIFNDFFFLIIIYFRFVKIKDIFVSYVKKIRLYSHSTKNLAVVTNVKTFIMASVGTDEISVQNVNASKNEIEFKTNALLKYN